jgi:hypothetical protein
MAESVVAKNMRDGTITLKVGANSYVIKYEEGSLQLNVPGPSVANYLDRGRLADTVGGVPSIRYNEDQPMTGSFSAYLRDISDASYVTAPEFILRSGQYSSLWGSSLGASAEVKTVDLQWDIVGAAHGDASDHQVLIAYCVLNGAVAEGSPNKVTINFTSYTLYPTVT